MPLQLQISELYQSSCSPLQPGKTFIKSNLNLTSIHAIRWVDNKAGQHVVYAVA